MRKANIKEYSRRLWAANLDAAVWFKQRSTVRNWTATTQERFSNAHIAFLKEAMKADTLPMLHVQRGNSKTGKIPCINMPMYLTCPSGAACRGYCYAGKECRNKYLFRYNSENLALYLRDKATFKTSVIAAIFNDSIIRWHESGDIVNADYFNVMVEVAKFYPNKRFYAYTKKYNIVNDYITKKGALPSNLTLIFSADKNLKMENPYFFPVAKIDFSNGEKIEGFSCPGKCTECVIGGIGCMNLQHGETVVFKAH